MHYNGANSYLFVNGTEIIKIKAKDTEITAYGLCLELMDKGIYDKRFIWNPGNCECECNILSVPAEYLDYANCKCRKRLFNKLVEEWSENIDEKELHLNELIIVNSNDYKNVCGSCTIYTVLQVIFFIANISINSVFIFIGT